MATTERPIFVIGDTHGQQAPLLEAIQQHPNAHLIHVGDFGIGFKPRAVEKAIIQRLSLALASTGSDMYIIRGNHDDPAYWTHKEIIEPHVNFVFDHTMLSLSGKRVYLAGGGISVDRCVRKEGISYWKDEAFWLPKVMQKQYSDFLITHSGLAVKYIPGQLGDISYYTDKDPKLEADLKREREKLEVLEQHIMAPVHICGHFHLSATVHIDSDKYIFLAENEVMQIA